MKSYKIVSTLQTRCKVHVPRDSYLTYIEHPVWVNAIQIMLCNKKKINRPILSTDDQLSTTKGDCDLKERVIVKA